jgi:hypothetical protein
MQVLRLNRWLLAGFRWFGLGFRAGPDSCWLCAGDVHMLLALLLQLALLLVLLRGPLCSLKVTKYRVSPAAAC